ncbi:hypothetical protein SWPG_00121 [Synechococcus phage S-CBM2]|nr:hypothetical protein SWPG_00121 [Synechococcus phage S-CBM2]
MFKTTIAAVVAAPLFAGAAMAGPYVNIESNTGLVGGEYGATLIENHIGYEGKLSETVTGYVQAGPAVAIPNGSDTELEVSGKFGINVAATDNLGIYGEVWGASTNGLEFDDFLTNLKVGVKYTF